MNLVGYTATALSRNDIEDTPTNKNVVDFAIVELKDLQGNLVTIYDDAEGLNPETQKTCDTDGLCTFFAESGDYIIEINGRAQRISLGVTAEVLAVAAAEVVEDAATEADRAEAAADAATVSGNVYEDTAAGIAATVDGDYFSVVSSDDENYLDLYKNDGGVAVYQKSYPSSLLVYDIQDNATYSSDTLRGFLIATGQLYDKYSSLNEYDKFVNWNTGNLQDSTNHVVAPTITVEPAGEYRFRFIDHYAFYDSSMVFISGAQSSGGSVITAPVGAAFMKYSFTYLNTNNVEKQIVSEGNSFSFDSAFSSVANNARISQLTSSSVKRRGLNVDSMAFIYNGKNLINKNELESGLSTSNGLFSENAGYRRTDFVPVTEGETYFFSDNGLASGVSYVTAYDENFKAIESEGSDVALNSITASAGVAYYKFSILANKIDKFQIETGGVTSYQKYKNFLSDEVEIDITPEKNSITTEMVNFISSKNLFDKTAITPNTFSSANGNETSNTTYFLSDYIEVVEGELYHCESGVTYNMRFLTAYDEELNVVESAGSNSGVASITVPVGVKYYRFTGFNDGLDLYQFEKGNQTSYTPFGIEFLDENVMVSGYDELKWKGKVFISYGDSITAQQEWQSQVAAALGLNHTAYGVGGRTISGSTGMCQASQLDALPTELDLLVVMGGTNDWAQDYPLGTIDSTDTNEFYGACNVLVTELMTRYPTDRVVFITTPYGELPQRVTDGVWNSSLINNKGLTTRGYAQAIRNICEKWGLPFIDSGACGWNNLNSSNFMKDDGGLLHPNEIGGNRLAEVVIGGLRAVTPVSVSN